MSAVSSASWALSTQTSCQPRSRTASASLCSTPKAPGSSSARLPTMATMGIRSAGAAGCCWTLTSASAMTALPLRRSSALSGDLQHVGNLLLVLPAETEAVGAVGAVRDLRHEPALVAVLVLPPRLPLAVVVRELGFV